MHKGYTSVYTWKRRKERHHVLNSFSIQVILLFPPLIKGCFWQRLRQPLQLWVSFLFCFPRCVQEMPRKDSLSSPVAHAHQGLPQSSHAAQQPPSTGVLFPLPQFSQLLSTHSLHSGPGLEERQNTSLTDQGPRRVFRTGPGADQINPSRASAGRRVPNGDLVAGPRSPLRFSIPSVIKREETPGPWLP